MNGVLQIAYMFLIFSAVFIAPHLTRNQGELAAAFCIVVSILFWIIGQRI